MAIFPTFTLSDLPAFELPTFDLPAFELPELPDVEQVAGYARDAAYVGVGLAVMTAERVQSLQQQLLEQLTGLVKDQIARVRRDA